MVPTTTKSFGNRVSLSPWLFHTWSVFGSPANRAHPESAMVKVPLPYSPLLSLLDAAAEVVGQQLDAVADSEDGDVEFEDGLVRKRASGAYTEDGPPERMIPPSDSASRFRTRGCRSEDRRIDAAFPDAPGDDLGVLGTKVEDDNLLVHGWPCKGKDVPARRSLYERFSQPGECV